MPDNPNNPDTPSNPPTLADKQIDLSPFALIVGQGAAPAQKIVHEMQHPAKGKSKSR